MINKELLNMDEAEWAALQRATAKLRAKQKKTTTTSEETPKSGVPGIYYNKARGSWKAYALQGTTKLYAGQSKSLEIAKMLQLRKQNEIEEI